MSLTGRPFLRRGPSGPLAPKFGLIQCGYDQPVKSQLLPTSGPVTVIPRDALLAPLQVQLLDIEPGNILEVDFDLNLVDSDVGGINVGVIPVVSFNGNVVLAPASGWFAMLNGQSGAGAVPSEAVALLRGLIAVEIPVDATIATVQLLYQTSADGLLIFGTDATSFGSPGSTLKVSEISILSVPQPGPSTLIPF